MKIAFDARMYSWTGIGRITHKLLEELPKLDSQNEYLVLLLDRDFDNWTPPAANFHKVRADFAPYSLNEQFGLPRLLYQLRPDLVHFLNFNLPFFYRRPFIVSINDLTLIDFKNFQGGGIRRLAYEVKYWVMRFILWNAVSAANRIVAISDYTKQDLHRRFRLSDRKIDVITLGVDPVKPAIESKTASEFLLYVGNPYPHKNLARLIEAFDLLHKDRPELKLVIVSNITAGNTLPFYNQLKAQAKRLGLEKAIEFPGYVDDDELNRLYRDATLFVFPSLAEGFGLPPLEAMAHGTPVASSSATSLPEVLEDAAVYFDPNSVEDMARVIDALLNSPDELARLRRIGPEQAAKFRWEDTARKTLSIYERLAL